MIGHIENLAPFAAGSALAALGACSAAALLGIKVPPQILEIMGQTSLPVSLMVMASGAGINIAAWEHYSLRKKLSAARQELDRAVTQRDLALVQARRMRAQAEGLALMREIHRSSAIPVRHDRLHRILTLLADLFEAKEVSLFLVSSEGALKLNRPEAKFRGSTAEVIPAACLRITNKEEIIVTFETERLAQLQAEAVQSGQIGDCTARIGVARKSAIIVREGCQLFVDGLLELGTTPIAKAQWRQGTNADQNVLTSQDASEILDGAIAKLDFGPNARALAMQALDRCRTVREDMVLCVPLMADQRAFGVLRMRRTVDNSTSPEAEALEEMLLESAKHIALALKKDEDDRAAITDALTSLYIKKHFLAMLDQFRAEASEDGGRSFCLVLCDIDHFKKVNDTHGHLSGDMILKGVAGVLRKGLRTGDMAFRYGGEEMAMLLPNSSIEAAEQTATRLRLAVESAVFKGEKGQTVPITISLGVSQFQPGLTGDTMISRADRALYASKQNGRNRATSWSQNLPDPLDKNKKDEMPARPTSKPVPVSTT